MMLEILLAATFARCEVGTLPVEDVTKENAPQAIQQALDQTFSVQGGTIAGKVFIASHTEVGGNLVISPSGWGITFPDGTRQTVAATTTAAEESWEVVETISPSAATAITSASFASDGYYKIVFRLTQNTAVGAHYIRINSDATAASYTWVFRSWSDAGVLATNSSTSDDLLRITGNQTVSAGERLNGVIYLWKVDGADNTMIRSHIDYDRNFQVLGGGRWTSGAPTSFRWLNGAGTFTGEIKVLKLK